MAERFFEVKDTDVLSAIECHTTPQHLIKMLLLLVRDLPEQLRLLVVYRV